MTTNQYYRTYSLSNYFKTDEELQWFIFLRKKKEKESCLSYKVYNEIFIITGAKILWKLLFQNDLLYYKYLKHLHHENR